MNFYDELGVPPNASPDEIRHAYRLRARQFHPDLQSDPILRDAAQEQMARLNEIRLVLGDPAARSRYDASLSFVALSRPVRAPETQRMARVVPSAPRARRSRWARWPLWAGAGLAAFSVYSAPGPSWDWVGTWFHSIAAAAPSWDGASEPPAGASTSLRPRPEAATSRPGSQDFGTADRDSDRAGFAGVWVGIPSDATGSETTGQQAQLALTEADGQIAGEYATPGSSASMLRFRVRGKDLSGDQTLLSFSGEDNARGHMRIALRSRDSLQIAWWSVKRGGSPGDSGTAFLTRVR